MGVGLTKILQVKIPVTDLRRSVSWYASVLDMELVAEFVEQGVLRGAALVDRDGGYVIALRDREVGASRPNLAGFDLFGLALSSEQGLHQLIERCDRLGVDHGEIQDREADRLTVVSRTRTEPCCDSSTPLRLLLITSSEWTLAMRDKLASIRSLSWRLRRSPEPTHVVSAASASVGMRPVRRHDLSRDRVLAGSRPACRDQEQLRLTFPRYGPEQFAGRIWRDVPLGRSSRLGERVGAVGP
jgi:catechol 2,3-dioxygenase-like lactoylglutathione lyase family enzyme